jgi:hypothetical protein
LPAECRSTVKVPEHLDWYVWRIVLAKIATLREIEEHWSLSDLLDAQDALDLQMRADAEAAKRASETRR